MTRTRWLVTVIVIFIFSCIALGISLFLYIYWFIKVKWGLERLLQDMGHGPVDISAVHTWVVITVLSVLVGIILIGLLVIFVYNIKILQLVRLQRNFIDNFTHELKTPVTSIKLFLETLIKHDLPREEQVKYLGHMLRETTRLENTIESMLELAAIDEKRYNKDLTEVDLAREIERFYKNNRHLFGNCVFRLHKPEGDRVLCRINRHLFEMLLMNIFTNALKYNRSNPPEIEVSLAKRNRRLFVRFTDNGIGIKPEERKKVFEKFYQSGTASDRTARGSGLGLYLVASIARMHRGKIWVEDGPGGKGSTFVLSMPHLSES